MTAIKPATPLPWNTNSRAVMPRIFGPERGLRGNSDQVPANHRDAAYIAHAANAYPKLVEALRVTLNACGDSMAGHQARTVLRELGESQ